MEPTTITPVASRSNPYLIPLSIIIAGLIIAGAVYFRGTTGPVANTGPTEKQLAKVAAPSAQDHIRGNVDAKVRVIVFTDLECPFCKEFHKTMDQLTKTYSPSEFAWVYRNFPILARHPKAQPEAEAAECVAELGGNDKYWQYVDKIFEVTPANNGLDLALLPKFATELGIDATKFKACTDSGKYKNLIKKQSEEATAAGGSGTPYGILINPDGDRIAIPGAIPFENMKQGIDNLLGKKAE